MNEFVELCGCVGPFWFGVVKTPCFPNSFYGGRLIRNNSRTHRFSYDPAYNGNGFFANENEAKAKAIKDWERASREREMVEHS